MKLCKAVAVICLAPALAGSSFAQTTTFKPQLAFSVEDEDVPHPVKLPDSVYSALKRDVMHDDPEVDTPPRTWFSAERLKQPSPQVNLYLVMAKGQLRGANVNEFWLVRNDTQSQEATILWNAPEHDVELRFKTGQPYPEIHAAKMSAVHLWEADFSFRNRKYIVTRSHDEDMK